jgi:hypothetical protein
VLNLHEFVPIFLTPDVLKNITSGYKTSGGKKHEENFAFRFFYSYGGSAAWRMHRCKGTF